MINPNILALPRVAIAIAEPFLARSATCRAFASSANNFSRVYSISIGGFSDRLRIDWLARMDESSRRV
jgi:hypothetical protein